MAKIALMNIINPQTEHLYTASLAGVSLTWAFRFEDTAKYLRKWISGPQEAPEDVCKVVRVSDQELKDWESFGNTIDAFAEFCLLCQQTSEALLPMDRCVIHAGAVRFRDRAYLISGGSGVGKSTQIRTLQELYSGEVSVINGDKPVLQAEENGTIIVHPSPWNGKEGWHGAEAAPLAGIFLMRRGAENDVRPAEIGFAAPFLYQQIFQSFTSEDIIKLAGAFEDKMLKNVPAYHFTNKEVPESTRLLMDTMEALSHGI